MRKSFLILIILPLAGCAGLVTAPPNPVTNKTVYELRLAYDTAFLIPATNYRRLGLCLGDTKSTFANPCAERAIVIKLQRADRAVQVALDNLQSFQLAYPTLDASAYIGAATRAISTAQQILAQ